MKWIKYQVVQDTIDGEVILLTKKIEHSEANLAIANTEAYDGYEIIEDEKSFEEKPLSIELGGTGGKTAEEARRNLGAASIEDMSKKATTAFYTSTLLANGWSSSAPYTQTIAVNGILANDTPFVDVYLESVSNGADVIEAWAVVSRVSTANNSVTAHCYEEKPTINIPIILKVVR